jgi:hypothetical protein
MNLGARTLRRIVYLVAAAILIASSAWPATSPDDTKWMPALASTLVVLSGAVAPWRSAPVEASPEPRTPTASGWASRAGNRHPLRLSPDSLITRPAPLPPLLPAESACGVGDRLACRVEHDDAGASALVRRPLQGDVIDDHVDARLPQKPGSSVSCFLVSDSQCHLDGPATSSRARLVKASSSLKSSWAATAGLTSHAKMRTAVSSAFMASCSLAAAASTLPTR